MINSAKPSISPRKDKHGLLRRFAPRNDGPHDMPSRSRRAFRASFALNFPPSPIGGRREGRVGAAPAVSRANAHSKNAHEHTGSAEAIRPSLRNGFTAYNALSPVTGFVATVIGGQIPPHPTPTYGAPEPTTLPHT